MSRFDEVNIIEVFSQIELELLKNLTASLASGNWRKQRLRAFREYQRRNKAIMERYDIDTALREQMENVYWEAGRQTAYDLELHGYTRQSDNHFRVDDRRMQALVRELQGDMHKVTYAARRQMDDRYRKGMAKTQTMLASNLFTMNECVDMATKDFLSSGVSCVKYRNGRQVNIASYAEMVLRTCNRRVTLQAGGAMRADFGVFTVLISQYGACSETCLPHQGKVHFDDFFAKGDPADNEGGYPLLSAAIKAGLFHPNCRHTSSTWYPGVNTIPAPMDEEKVKEAAALEEKQRYNERQIRKWKRMRDASTDPANRAKYDRKVKEWQAKQRKLISAHPDVLRRDYHREKIYSAPDTFQSDDGKGIINTSTLSDEEISSLQAPPSQTLDDEGQEALNGYTQQIMRTIKDEPPGTECAITASWPDMAYKETAFGDAGAHIVSIPVSSDPFVALHTHPNNSSFSARDIRTFIRLNSLKIMQAVCNDGTSYLLEKLPGYDEAAFADFIKRLLAIDSSSGTIARILESEAQKYGVNYQSRNP